MAFVHKDSPAALAGLRFGDQILQIDGQNTAGWDTDKCMSVLKKCKADKITMAIRDRYGVAGQQLETSGCHVENP